MYHVIVKAVSSILEDIIWYTSSLNGQMVFMSRITISSKTGQTKSLRNRIKILKWLSLKVYDFLKRANESRSL